MGNDAIPGEEKKTTSGLPPLQNGMLAGNQTKLRVKKPKPLNGATVISKPLPPLPSTTANGQVGGNQTGVTENKPSPLSDTTEISTPLPSLQSDTNQSMLQNKMVTNSKVVLNQFVDISNEWYSTKKEDRGWKNPTLEAIVSYIGTGYETINGILRAKNREDVISKIPEPAQPMFKNYVKEFTQNVDQYPVLPGDVRVYRGGNSYILGEKYQKLIQQILQRKASPSELNNASGDNSAVLSTSYKRQHSLDFAKRGHVFITFTAKAGTHALGITHGVEGRTPKNEAEIIFLPKTYQITVQSAQLMHETSGTYLYIYATIAPLQQEPAQNMVQESAENVLQEPTQNTGQKPKLIVPKVNATKPRK